MYSRSYTDRSNAAAQMERSDIPIEAFTDNSGEELFKMKIANNEAHYNTYEDKRELKKDERENIENNCHVSKDQGFLSNISFSRLFGGILEKIQLDDIILVALIILFMSDNNKDNDILIPILLAIILLF